MPVDPSVFNNIKTYQDYKNAQDAVDLQRAQVGAQLQGANIDALTKQNLLKGQYLSAAAGTGDQGTWDATRQKLGGLGIDVSDVPPDVATGTQYANSLKIAQSPYGALINGGKAISDMTGTIPSALSSLIGGNTIPTSRALPDRSIPSDNGMRTQPPIIPVQNGGELAPVGSTVAPQINGSDLSLDPTIARAVSNQSTSGINLPAKSPNVVLAPQIAMPTRDLSETFTAYKERPDVIAAQAKAKKTGEDSAAAQKAAIDSSENFNLVDQNLTSLERLNPNIPSQGVILSAQGKADFNQRFGGDDKSIANALSSAKLLNESQIINAIKNLASSGQIRMSRTLENIINRGYLIDLNLDAKGRQDQINIIRSEMKNGAVNANNVNASINGGQTQEYTNPIPIQQLSNQKSISDYGIGKIHVGDDGVTYLQVGKDPTNPNSYKVIKGAR